MAYVDISDDGRSFEEVPIPAVHILVLLQKLLEQVPVAAREIDRLLNQYYTYEANLRDGRALMRMPV